MHRWDRCQLVKSEWKYLHIILLDYYIVNRLMCEQYSIELTKKMPQVNMLDIFEVKMSTEQ